MKLLKHQTSGQSQPHPKDDLADPHPPQADDMTMTAHYPVLPPHSRASEEEEEEEPDVQAQQHIHIGTLQRLRRLRKPGWLRRRLKWGIFLTMLIFLLTYSGEVVFMPDTPNMLPPSCTAVGSMDRDTSGIRAQLALCHGIYSLVVQQADGVTMQQPIRVWILHSLSPKKAIYEAQATFFFSDQTQVVVEMERTGKSGKPRILWERVS